MPSISARSIRGAATAVALLTFGLPAAASATGSTSTPRRTVLPPQFQVPASARVHGASTNPASAAHSALPAQSGVPASARVRTPTSATTPSLAPGAKAATPTGVPTTPTTVPATPTTVPATPTVQAAGAPAKAAQPAGESRRLSTGAIVAAALAALLIAVCLAWGAARWWAYEPRWMVTLRHSLAEAGWRLSATWDEFADWARIGR